MRLTLLVLVNQVKKIIKIIDWKIFSLSFKQPPACRASYLNVIEFLQIKHGAFNANCTKEQCICYLYKRLI